MGLGLAAFFSLSLVQGPVTRRLFSTKRTCPGAPGPQVESDTARSLPGPGRGDGGAPGPKEDKTLEPQALLHTPRLENLVLEGRRAQRPAPAAAAPPDVVPCGPWTAEPS